MLIPPPEGDGGTEGSEKVLDSSLGRRRATSGEFREFAFNRCANGWPTVSADAVALVSVPFLLPLWLCGLLLLLFELL